MVTGKASHSIFLAAAIAAAALFASCSPNGPDATGRDGVTGADNAGSNAAGSNVGIGDGGPGDVPEAAAELAANACDSEVAYFENEVFRPLLSVQCIGCHNAEGPAGQSRMVLLPETADGYLEHNLAQVAAVATEPAGDSVLLLAMPSDTHPERQHPGGELVPEGSVDYDRLETLVAQLTADGCDESMGTVDCAQVSPGPRQLRRLTPVQFDNTVTDLLGVEGSWGESFPADPVVHGFDNKASELLVTPLLADKLQVAAEEIAEQVDLSTLVPCDVATGSDECARQFVRDLGTRAFRRPLTEGDVDRYVALYDVADGFEAGSRLVITAMLQSPHFLYRFEVGEPAGDGSYRLTNYEVASELSYLIWDTMPDEALFEAAAAGELTDVANIAAQAERLMASPRAKPVFRRFVSQWLFLNRLETVPKDGESFPELSPAVRKSMLAEANAIVDHVIYESSGRLPELLTAPVAFVDEALAGFYGVSAGGGGMQPVEVPERSGLLTQGGVMLTHARSNDSSPVHRGKLVRERFLCQVPPPPPPGINAEPPPLDPSLTARERYAAHSQEEPCRGCHRLMDPIGFAFEQFDGVGRYRTEENGNPIDVSGEIVNSERTDATFEGTEELASLLAESPDVHDCFALHWFRYGYGLSDEKENQCLVESIQREFAARDLTIQGLVLALTQTVHFTMRAPGDSAAASDEPASDGTTGSDPVSDPPPDDPEPADAGSGSDDPADPPDPPAEQSLELVESNEWASGYCHTYEITNTGTSELAWSVTLELMGTLNHNWESTADGDSGQVTFSGAAHNRTIAPGATARFGFCVDR